MVTGEREIGWQDVVDYARTREFSGAPEMGAVQGPGLVQVMQPMDGVYHRPALGAKGAPRKEATLCSGEERD